MLPNNCLCCSILKKVKFCLPQIACIAAAILRFGNTFPAAITYIAANFFLVVKNYFLLQPHPFIAANSFTAAATYITVNSFPT